MGWVVLVILLVCAAFALKGPWEWYKDSRMRNQPREGDEKESGI